MSHIENMERKNRGVFLLPHLFTTGAMFAGFYAIISAMNSEFINASMMIFLAMLLDGLDGRIARMTGTQSEFGAQFDSLSDMVSFGVAPAVLLYTWGAAGLGKFGWLSVFFFSTATALRLAKFNTQASCDRRFFTGLPCPAAACVIAGFVWVITDSTSLDNQMFEILVIAASISVVTSFLMVSNVKYFSFKELNFKGRVPFFTVLMITIGYMLIALDPPIMLFCIFLFYVLSGPMLQLNKIIFYNQKNAKITNMKKAG